MSELDRSEFSHLLPHGPGMQLIDNVMNCDEKTILCKTFSHTRLNNPLYTNGILPVTAYIEYAAQVAGLHLGLSRQHESGQTPIAGYIGTLKDIEFYIFDQITDEISISADVLIKEQKNAIYHFLISTSTASIAEGRISLSQA